MDNVLCCGTCHVKVSKVTNPDGSVWYGHPGQAKHEVTPVWLPEREVIRVCDFCLAPGPGWAIPLRDHADTSRFNPDIGFNVTALDTDAWWGACDTCMELINARKIGELRDRALAVAERVHGGLTEWEKQSVLGQLAAFWLASPGPGIEVSVLQAD